MKRLSISLTFSAALAFAQDPRIPIDNEHVKVLKVTQDPNVRTRPHQHDVNRVMVYLQPGKQTIAYQEGKVVNLNWKAGEALWSPKSGIHVAELVSAKPVTIVEVELKKPGSKAPVKYPALDPVTIDPKRYKVELDNDQVRVVRVKLPGKGKIAMHEHGLNRVVVYLTDMDFKITAPDGKESNVTHKAGDVSFGTPNKHAEENLSSKPFEIVVIEIKG